MTTMDFMPMINQMGFTGDNFILYMLSPGNKKDMSYKVICRDLKHRNDSKLKMAIYKDFLSIHSQSTLDIIGNMLTHKVCDAIIVSFHNESACLTFNRTSTGTRIGVNVSNFDELIKSHSQ